MSRPIKGLMIKDLRLVFSQMKLFFVIMAVWGIFMAVNIEQFYFVPAYTAVFCTFISLSTYSYDEFENGTAYLHTAYTAQGLCACEVSAGHSVYDGANHCDNVCRLCGWHGNKRGSSSVGVLCCNRDFHRDCACAARSGKSFVYSIWTGKEQDFQAGQFWHYRRRLGGDWLAGRGISGWYERHQQHIGAGFVDAHAADGGS